jgi:hypothetical protein
MTFTDGVLAAMCLASSLAPVALAQPTWQLRASGTPPDRYAAAIAYDDARARCVLFGGRSFLRGYADTWEWDGNTWQQRLPAAAPTARWGHGMVYDRGRQRVVLIGGAGLGTGQHWEFDGNAWHQVSTPTWPPVESGFAMCYDAARGRVVVFAAPPAANETWEYDGTAWSERTPASSPPARGGASLAYDAMRQRSVLFGGGGPAAMLADTWEWDGVRWTQRFPVHSPPARSGHQMTYDPAQGRTVLFSGTDGARLLDDVWEWDGTDWLERRPRSTPSARAAFAMASDARRGRAVVFGGATSMFSALSDTWEYTSAPAASYASFGSGCAGSAGVPALGAGAGELPWSGGTFTLQLNALPPAPAGVPFGIVGASATTWGSFPLPLPLTAIGMTGCSLWVSFDVVVPLVNAGGRASWSLPIPGSQHLLGASVHLQGGVLDPAANPRGVTLTNAGTATIAVR